MSRATRLSSNCFGSGVPDSKLKPLDWSRDSLGFGLRVLVATRTSRDVPGVKMVSREQLFAQSDIISLHCPQTSETTGRINADSIELMKRGVILINTSRGGLINEAALADALNSGRLAGAGLDVLSTEPPAKDNPLPGASVSSNLRQFAFLALLFFFLSRGLSVCTLSLIHWRHHEKKSVRYLYIAGHGSVR